MYSLATEKPTVFLRTAWLQSGFILKRSVEILFPHAVLPFGKMSVGAYSGGYPTGYGMHYPNSCGGIQKLGEIHRIKGFSHLHHSGTGAVRYYYNYVLTTPFYGEDISVIDEGQILENEAARPGSSKAKLGDILCEMTIEGGVAIHRYTFGRDGGRVAIDFSNNGLAKDSHIAVRNAVIKYDNEFGISDKELSDEE